MTTSTYNLPPIDYGNPPRKVKWTGAKPIRIVAYLLIAFAVWGVIGGYYGGYTLTRALYLHGEVTSASIITKHYTQGKTRTHFFDLFYLDGFKSYSPEIEVSKLDYDRYYQGSSITITFLPSDHNQLELGRVTAAGVESSFHGFVVTVIVTLVIACVLIWMLERSLWKEYRLLQTGVIVDAVVESVEPYTIKSTACLRLRYRFDIDGHDGLGLHSVKGVPASGPQIGSTVKVIASPTDPAVNKPIVQITLVGLA